MGNLDAALLKSFNFATGINVLHLLDMLGQGQDAGRSELERPFDHRLVLSVSLTILIKI